MKFKTAALFLALLGYPHVSHADFVGPSHALGAMSPDGNLLVRITPDKRELKPDQTPKHLLTFYQYDAKTDSFLRRQQFELDGLSQMLYVSNAGDLVMIVLGEKEAISLYSKEGKLAKVWNLDDFLTEAEIKACAKTGSTLQWLEEGSFFDREFYFRGPSRLIRALPPPYTVMRGADDKVWFSGAIDAATAKLSKDKPEER